MADAEVSRHGGSGMAVEQHLHRFLLEFVGVDAAPRLEWVFVGFHGSLLGCLVRVTPSSRSVHKSPYTSHVKANHVGILTDLARCRLKHAHDLVQNLFGEKPAGLPLDGRLLDEFSLGKAALA